MGHNGPNTEEIILVQNEGISVLGPIFLCSHNIDWPNNTLKEETSFQIESVRRGFLSKKYKKFFKDCKNDYKQSGQRGGTIALKLGFTYVRGASLICAP